MKASNRVRFGRIVRERRLKLGLTQDDVFVAGGPSDTTQTRVERGGGPEPSVSTLNKFDAALRWEPGSAARTWRGGHPTPVPDPISVHGASPAAFALGPMEVPVSLEELTKLLDIHSTLVTASEADPDNALLTRAVSEMKEFVSSLTGTWVTEILERNAHAANGIPVMIEFAFSSHLAAPVDLSSPEAEERLYRRWLAGRTDNISDEQEADFTERLARRQEAPKS